MNRKLTNRDRFIEALKSDIYEATDMMEKLLQSNVYNYIDIKKYFDGTITDPIAYLKSKGECYIYPPEYELKIASLQAGKDKDKDFHKQYAEDHKRRAVILENSCHMFGEKYMRVYVFDVKQIMSVPAELVRII